jgi:hypothetical protein
MQRYLAHPGEPRQADAPDASDASRFGALPPATVDATPEAWQRANRFRVS